MKLANCFASAGLALMLGVAIPCAWGQATEPGAPNAGTVAPSATSPVVPGEKAAPGAPGSAMSAGAPAASSSQSDQMSSGYVSQKISEAQARGKDVRLAKTQQAMGEAALKKGMNNEAAQHFETALRSIGVMP